MGPTDDIIQAQCALRQAVSPLLVGFISKYEDARQTWRTQDNAHSEAAYLWRAIIKKSGHLDVLCAALAECCANIQLII